MDLDYFRIYRVERRTTGGLSPSDFTISRTEPFCFAYDNALFYLHQFLNQPMHFYGLGSPFEGGIGAGRLVPTREVARPRLGRSGMVRVLRKRGGGAMKEGDVSELMGPMAREKIGSGGEVNERDVPQLGEVMRPMGVGAKEVSPSLQPFQPTVLLSLLSTRELLPPHLSPDLVPSSLSQTQGPHPPHLGLNLPLTQGVGDVVELFCVKEYRLSQLKIKSKHIPSLPFGSKFLSIII
jgi:hypothetical protein